MYKSLLISVYKFPHTSDNIPGKDSVGCVVKLEGTVYFEVLRLLSVAVRSQEEDGSDEVASVSVGAGLVSYT